jgi:cathepsin A (carboxypeptidase C)
MKLLSSAAIIGVAAAFQPQQILKDVQHSFTEQNPLKDAAKPIAEAWSKSLNHLSESMKHMSAEAKAVWDEVSMQFPEEMSKATFFSSPKPNTRKPDSTWDYVVKGADVQSVWVENSSGQKERMVDGQLSNFNLRAKKVDPSKLGVDTVKQYSGYLDDEEEDKVVFPTAANRLKLTPSSICSTGSSSPEMTPKMTPLCSG